ncbi:MAG: GHKL domain-containing protein, partial [Clostridiales bacterium]|nr:GHKL domain-containing protein [Clostridiales bacterium]
MRVAVIVNSLLSMVINCVAFAVCFELPRHNRVKYISSIIGITAALAIVNGMPAVSQIMFRFIPNGVFFLPILFFLKIGNIFQRVFFCFSVITLNRLRTLWAGFIAEFFFPYGSGGYLIIWCVALAVLLVIFAVLIFANGKKLMNDLIIRSGGLGWAFYATYPVTASFGLYYAYFSAGELPLPPQAWAGYYLFHLFVFVGFILLYVSIMTTHKKAAADYEINISRNVIASGRYHYRKMDEMYEKIRVLRHDYKYHLNAARSMIQTGDHDGAGMYLTDVEDQLTACEIPMYCSNSVINALVDGYAERCAKLDIDFDIKLAIPKTLGIPDYDLCIILGNLLENAVEASEKLERGRSIKLAAHSNPPQCIVMVKNSFDGGVNH